MAGADLTASGRHSVRLGHEQEEGGGSNMQARMDSGRGRRAGVEIAGRATGPGRPGFGPSGAGLSPEQSRAAPAGKNVAGQRGEEKATAENRPTGQN